MKTTLTIIAFLMAPLFSFGQDLISRGYTQTTIEKGSTFKKHKNGKLDSIVVAMYAVNYGNALIFAKLHDEIRITNAEDKHSVITIGLKNKKQVLTFFYNNKPAIIVENIDFNIGKLPKNTIITRSLSDNMIRTVSVTTNYGVLVMIIRTKRISSFMVSKSVLIWITSTLYSKISESFSVKRMRF